MKLHFYGTGASEGVPAIFCECAYCKKIRALGGKNYRLRTCAQVDENLLRRLGINVSCEARYETKKLYHK